MKSIKKDDQVKRVADSESESFIKLGWSYISKSEWKKLRPAKLDKTKKSDKKAGKNK